MGHVRRFFRVKAQRFNANGGDTCGCRNPLEGVVVATFIVLGLRAVADLDHECWRGKKKLPRSRGGQLEIFFVLYGQK
jgi:hypothetical protein